MGRYPMTLYRGIPLDLETRRVCRSLQDHLTMRGIPIDTNGRYTELVENAVRAFQMQRGLTDDGVCGPQTWAELLPKTVMYRQNDPRWNDIPYTAIGDKKQTIGTSGSGPTCSAMIIATLSDPSITPIETSKWALRDGRRTANKGTDIEHFFDMAERFSLKAFYAPQNSKQACRYWLNQGGLVLANMGPGYFTDYGHYVVIWNYDFKTSLMYMHDPASGNRFVRKASAVQKEVKRYIIFTK